MEQFFRSRGKGFYVSLSACVLSLITLILYLIYGTAGGGQQYFSVAVIVLLAVSIIAYFVMCIFKYSEAWAPFVQTALIFIAFLLYICAVYRYFTEVFYGGINANAFAIMNKWFLFSLIIFILNVVVSQIGVHMHQTNNVIPDTNEQTGQSGQIVSQ